jgi:MoxR-like ATPase
MQEHRVTVGGKTYHLPEPFFVLATQNPIEQEGTYPLPEAQLDRFLFNIKVDYPNLEEERIIIKQVTGNHTVELSATLTAQDVLKLQRLVKRIPVADHVINYACDLARGSRPDSPDSPDFVKELVSWGAGPRAGISLVTAAKANAILHGRLHSTIEDINYVATPVLRHRIITTFNAESAEITSDDIIKMLLDYYKPKVELNI